METSVFTVHVSFQIQGLNEETSLSIEFNAEDRIAAVKAGAAWAKNRVESVKEKADFFNSSLRKEVSIGCVKVGIKSIGEVDDKGFIDSGFKGYFFEWKCDYPETLENYVSHFEKENKNKLFKDWSKDVPHQIRCARQGGLLEMAENLRDMNHLFHTNELRYVNEKIEAPVGFWAYKKIRDFVSKEAGEFKKKEEAKNE